MFRDAFVNILTSMKSIDPAELKATKEKYEKEDVSELALVNCKSFDPGLFAQKMSRKFGMKYLDLSAAKIDPTISNSVKKPNVIKYRSIPILKNKREIVLATFDPSIGSMLDEMGKTLGSKVDLILTPFSAWAKLFQQIDENLDDLLGKIEEVKINNEENTDEKVKESDIGEEVINFVNRILAEAFIKKASDIHIEPYQDDFRIRLRIDGQLATVLRPPKSMMMPIISRIKIMAQMDISERRKPQDGRIKVRIGTKEVDYRTSSLPTLFGEKMVLRVLDMENIQLDMTKLGFEEKQLTTFKDGIHRPYGMALVTGPTGSGKTTTLYSSLADLNKPNRNISTAEDPVEFNFKGINQVNVRKDIGLTFASALKAFLRQDPDVIMVGEIRDLETAEIAVEAALTGHMVLSTLHTNDAASTITRLLNMGIEPFLIVGAINVVLAQRLCRKICANCRIEDSVPVDYLIKSGFGENTANRIKVFRGEGCIKCNQTGYKGRLAIYEVLSMSPDIRELVLMNASTDRIKKQAMREGMKSLRMSALTKVAQGLTTLEEAISNSNKD